MKNQDKALFGKPEVIRTVLPGDEILDLSEHDSEQKIFLGPGVRWYKSKVKATRAGLLKKDGKNLYYVDSIQKRYVPQRKEFVIGIVIRKLGDNYLVDIGGQEPATISFLAFENASKKTRVDLKLGDLLYGQLLVADKDMSPELVCIDVYNQSVGMGSLPEGGLLFTIPLHIARSLIDPENPFLLHVAKRIPYSIVIGFNGRVYVRAQKHVELVAIMHAISMLEVMPISEAMKNLDKMLDSFLLVRVH